MKGTSLFLLMFFVACAPQWAQSRARAPKTPVRQPGPPWRGWDTYQTILWSTQTPASPDAWPGRVREAGYTAVPISADPLPGLGHYVANMVAELGFHHSREPLYKTDLAGYTATRDKRFLMRKPCFDDPSFWEQLTPRLTAQIARFAPARPLLYDLRDEPSIGAFISPMDYCFCPHTLHAFREWLKTQYRSLADLNAEWETSFSAWQDATPLTTYEIKDRERSKPGSFAPWADHRAFMDLSFARALDRMRSIVRAHDPETPVGIAGVQAPGAFGGYDLWRLSRAVDWMEPYDQGSSRAIVGSFLPAAAPILATYFGSNEAELRRTAWARLLDGDRGAVVWDDNPDRVILKAASNLPITPRGHMFRDILSSIRTAAPQLATLRPQRDRIAIHYSQASIRAQWMIDSRPDGATWPRRLASYEVEHSTLIKLRAGYLRAVEDLGLTPEFVSYEQIEKGQLTGGKYRALLLPGSVAMSSAECERITEFVRGGGTVIADDAVATFDEHCRRVPAGSRESFRRAIDRRGPPAVGDAFRRAGIDAPVKTSAPGVRIWRFAGGGREVIALMQNPARPARSTVRARVVLPRRARVRNGSKDLGETREVDVEIGPTTPVMLEIR